MQYRISPIEARKDIEKVLLNAIIRRNSNIVIHRLSESGEGRILAYSPYEADMKTSAYIPRELRWLYSHLSKNIHDLEDDRYTIEQKINNIIPIITDQPLHLFYNIIENKDELLKYCNSNNLSFPNKSKYNYVLKLIKRWRAESKKYHISMTKQDKRKLKKKFRQNQEKMFEELKLQDYFL